MKNNLILVIAVALIGLFSFTTKGFSADKPTNMTNLQLAQLLVQKLNITLPAGSDKLAPAGYYNALANALAAKGENRFLKVKPDDFFTCADLADVLYIIAGGKEKLDAKGEFDYLVKNGYMNTCPANLDGRVSTQFVNDVFSNPKLSGLIAEAYSRPGPARNDRNPGANAPGVGHENVAFGKPGPQPAASPTSTE